MIGLDDLCLATGGQLYGEAIVREFSGIADDPDRVRPGELFVVTAIPEAGQSRDIERALAAGASGLLCETPPSRDVSGSTTVLVGDARFGLEQWAAFVMRQVHPVTIVVVGDYGRASLCEAVSNVLGSRFPVYSSAGLPAGPFQVPVAVGRLEPQHTHAVFELSPDRFNSLADMVGMLQPQVMVVSSPVAQGAGRSVPRTAIPDDLREAITRLPAKTAIVADEADRSLLSAVIPEGIRLLTYQAADQLVSANLPEVACEQVRCELDSFTLNLRVGRDEFRDVRLPGVAAPAVGRVLAALAVCVALSFPAGDALAVLASQVVQKDVRVVGVAGGAILVDASIGAGPQLALALLDWLDQVGAQVRRRYLVLGDLAPDGEQFVGLSREIGRHALRTLDALIVLDDSASPVAQAARQAGYPPAAILLPHERSEAAEFMRTGVAAGDILVVVSGRPSTVSPFLQSVMGESIAGASGLTPRPAEVRTPIVERAWLEIDLAAISENVALIRRNLQSGVALIGVVKDDAFRHGAAPVSRVALQAGADMLAVSTVAEGLALRAAGLDCPILTLGYSPAESISEAIAAGLTLSILSRTHADLLAHAGRRMKARPACHIRVAAGPRQAGVPLAEVVTLVREFRKADQLELAGLYVELSSMPGPGWVADGTRLLQQFSQVSRNLSAAGVDIPLVHAVGSAALLTIPNSTFSAARIGHLIYGVTPFSTNQRPAGLKPALAWKTVIADQIVEHSGRSPSTADRRIAVLPIGYRDGLSRSPRGEMVLIGGQRAPLVDPVGPDWAYVDVSSLPDACIGSEVVLIGGQGGDRITVEELAGARGVASYEVISMIPSALLRLYNR